MRESKIVNFVFAAGFLALSSFTVAIGVGCTCVPEIIVPKAVTQGGIAYAQDYYGAPFTWDRYNTPVVTLTTSGTSTTASVTYLNKSGTFASANKFKFNKDLYTWNSVNKISPDVTELQKVLVAEKLLGINSQTGIYDIPTRTAVEMFQKKYGIKPASQYPYGYFGPITRAFINSKTTLAIN